MTDTSTEQDVEQYVREHRKFLSGLLATGDVRAQAYALALVEAGATAEDLEHIIDYLQQLKHDRTA